MFISMREAERWYRLAQKDARWLPLVELLSDGVLRLLRSRYGELPSQETRSPQQAEREPRTE